MRITLFLLLFVLLCWMTIPISVSAKEEVREVTGYGVSKKEAVINGLLEAIQQVKGARLKGAEKLHSYFEEAYDTRNGVDTSKSSMSSSQQEDIYKQVQGIVSSYELLDMSPGENGHGWDAILRVYVPRYEPPGISPHSRRKLAVMPFRYTASSFTVGNRIIPAEELSRQFTQKLVTELTQSRRFTVLDREYICEYFREKKLLLSGDTPLEEQVRLGEVLGIDYMVVGTISKAAITRTAYQIKTLGRTGYRDKATFVVDYRIIVLPNRQVKWADSVSLTVDNKQLHQLAGSNDMEAMQQAILEKAARELTHKALSNIYPIRVAAIQPDGTLILNQGGMTIKKGEVFDIFRTGKKVIDPYSKESLGAAETRVAIASVERVLAKQSYAEIIKGDPNQVRVMDICRRVAPKKQPAPKPPQKIAVPW